MATILVVEDEQAIRQLICEILRGAGHTVITAANGFEGIALFRSTPDQFDLILTDLQMPVMNGQQFVELARATSASTKIICMSGYTADSIPATTEFLPKPFEPSILRARVNQLLNRRLSAQPLYSTVFDCPVYPESTFGRRTLRCAELLSIDWWDNGISKIMAARRRGSVLVMVERVEPANPGCL